jgi:hypothetical protein
MLQCLQAEEIRKAMTMKTKWFKNPTIMKTRWFRNPTDEQVALIKSHCGKRVIEPFCGASPLFDMCDDLEWAIGIDKAFLGHLDSVRDRKDIHAAYVQDWALVHADDLSKADTIIMSYPPNSCPSDAGTLILSKMHDGQKLILAVPRPWGNYMVAGTETFWAYILKNFWVLGSSGGNGLGNIDFVYVFSKSQHEKAEPAISIMDGHDLFEL